MTDDLIVRATGLTRRFRDLAAVDDATFDLREGRIHGLLGRNGAGKTTLMHLLTGQDFPTAGSLDDAVHSLLVVEFK